MALLQLVISIDTGDDKPEDVLASVLEKLPEDPAFGDVAQNIDGVWVDEEGDPL